MVDTVFFVFDTPYGLRAHLQNIFVLDWERIVCPVLQGSASEPCKTGHFGEIMHIIIGVNNYSLLFSALSALYFDA